MLAETASSAWRDDERGFKTLALEHKLAAKRGGFFEVYSAMELLDKDAATPKTSGDRSGPSMVHPLLGPLLELAECMQPDGLLNEFAAMDVLRRHGALANVPEAIEERERAQDDIHTAVTNFINASANPGATVRDVLTPVLTARLFEADYRLVQAYGDPSPPPEKARGESKEDRRKRGWHDLFNAPWQEISRYRSYLGGEAELATHQVVKGSEFKHVMVIMDDEEAAGTMFSYDKLFGAKELSPTDLEKAEEGQETIIDRTLRLLYVTCSRAEESLALVLWANNPTAAIDSIRSSGWFSVGEVRTLK